MPSTCCKRLASQPIIGEGWIFQASLLHTNPVRVSLGARYIYKLGLTKSKQLNRSPSYMKVYKLVFSAIPKLRSSCLNEFCLSFLYSFLSSPFSFFLSFSHAPLFSPSLLLLCSHLGIGTISVELVMGNVEIERLIILLPTESALLECIFPFLNYQVRVCYVFLLLFFKWAFRQLRDIKTSFIFFNNLFIKMWPSNWTNICWQRGSQQWLQIIVRGS